MNPVSRTIQDMSALPRIPMTIGGTPVTLHLMDAEQWFNKRPEDEKRFVVDARNVDQQTRRAAVAIFQVEAKERFHPEARVYLIVREEGYVDKEIMSLTVYDNMIDKNADHSPATRVILPTDAKFSRETIYRQKVFLDGSGKDPTATTHALIQRYLNDPLFTVLL